MRTKKRVPCLGLAFFEDFEMNRLAKYAKKGWLLKRFSFTDYILTKSEPMDLVYSLDYQKDTCEDYFRLFEDAGWNYVCSAGCEIHIFSAVPGTNPIYTDRATHQDKYLREQKEMKKYALPSFFLFLLLLGATTVCTAYSAPAFIWIPALILTFIVTVVMVFSGLPYLAYLKKTKKLSKTNDF